MSPARSLVFAGGSWTRSRARISVSTSTSPSDSFSSSPTVLPASGEPSGIVDLGGVALEVEGRVHRGRALAVARQQPPAEREEDHAADREAGADRREVEHRERLAERSPRACARR